MKKIFTLVACAILILAFVASAMAFGGSSDVKAYGSIDASYGQGVTNTDLAREYGDVTTNKEVTDANVSGMGALNLVGCSGGMAVVDGKFNLTESTTWINAHYDVSTSGSQMIGANDMTGAAGVAAASTGCAGANGSSDVFQTLTQNNYQSNGCFVPVNSQSYTGTVNISTGAGAF